MTKRIFKSIFAVSLIVLATCTGVTLGILYHYFGNQLQKELKTEAAYLAIAVERDGIDALEALPAQAERVTYIDEDGTVLFDNVADSESMENHAQREEIEEAQKTGSGTADPFREKIHYRKK